jgi:hypothetical protein
MLISLPGEDVFEGVEESVGEGVGSAGTGSSLTPSMLKSSVSNTTRHS